MKDYQFTCKNCGRTTFADYYAITKTYENTALTLQECSHCGYICYACSQLNDLREKETTIRKNRNVGTIKENLTVGSDSSKINKNCQ